MMLRLTLRVLMLTFSINCIAQVSMEYKNYLFNKSVINPAYIGFDDGIVSYTSFGHEDFYTNSFTIGTQTPISRPHEMPGHHRPRHSAWHGVGARFVAFNENGVMSDASYLGYSYTYKFRKGIKLIAGIEPGILRSRVEDIHPSYDEGISTYKYSFDMNCGIAAVHRFFKIGLSTMHIFTPTSYKPGSVNLHPVTEATTTSRRFIANGNLYIPLSERMKWYPELLVYLDPNSSDALQISNTIMLQIDRNQLYVTHSLNEFGRHGIRVGYQKILGRILGSINYLIETDFKLWSYHLVALRFHVPLRGWIGTPATLWH